MSIRGQNAPRPGSYGLNTQITVIENEDHRWAAVAQNGVIDNSGRLTSRKDFVQQTSGFSGNVESLYVHNNTAGTQTVLSAAVGKIYSGTSTLTERHDYSGTSTTLNSWAFASLSSKIFGFQAGVAPFVLNEVTFAAEAFTGAPWTNSPNVILAASGRLWAADDAAGSNSYTLWWSNLLDGKVWNAGDAGSLNVQRVWPGGQDSIVAVAIQQDRVIIFGKKNILLYTLPSDRNPANMTLTDSITNLGCIARDSVILVNGDLYFLARDGYYKINRLAQVTSLMAAVRVTINVADDFNSSFSGETMHKVRAGYNDTDKLLVLSSPTNNHTWCFHPDRLVPTGDTITVPVVTRWTNTSNPFRAFAYDGSGNFYCAFANGIGKYSGYTPDGAASAYNFLFTGLWNTMQDGTRGKNLKNFAVTVDAAVAQTFTFRWQVDHSSTIRTYSVAAGTAVDDDGARIIRGPIGGECSVAKFGLLAAINGNQVILNSLRIYGTPGRTMVHR